MDSGASMHMVSKRDLHSAELETMRISKTPTTVITANGEVQAREEATFVKQLDFLSKLCFLKKLSQFSPWRKSERIMGIHTTRPAVKNHISSEMARELFAICPTVYHLWFLVYQRVLPHLHQHLHHLHHRIPYLMSTDTPKIQCSKKKWKCE